MKKETRKIIVRTYGHHQTRLTATITKEANSTQASEWTLRVEIEQNEKLREDKFQSLIYLGLTSHIISPLLMVL